MEQYAGGRTCRRTVLLDYFGQERVSCDGCDICGGTAARGAAGLEPTGAEESLGDLGRLVRRLARQSASARR